MNTKNVKWLFKRAKRLLIPFLFWIGIHYLLLQQHDISIVERYIITIKNPADNGLWFLVVLFYICIVSCIIEKITFGFKYILKNNNDNIELYVVFCITIILTILAKYFPQLNNQRFIWYMHFYMFGYVVSKMNFKISNKVVILILCIIYCLLVPFWKRTGDPNINICINETVKSMILILYRYLVPTLAILIITNINFSIITKSTLGQGLTILGKNSLAIYAMQWYFFGVRVNYYWMNVILISICASVMPVFIAKHIISANRWLKCLALGEKG